MDAIEVNSLDAFPALACNGSSEIRVVGGGGGGGIERGLCTDTVDIGTGSPIPVLISSGSINDATTNNNQ